MIENWYKEIFDEFEKAVENYDKWFYSQPEIKRPKETIIYPTVSPSTSIISHYSYLYTSNPSISIRGVSRVESVEAYRGHALEVIHFYGGIPRVKIPISRYKPDKYKFVSDCNKAFKEWISELPKEIYTIIHPKQTFLDPEPGSYDLFYITSTCTRNLSWKQGELRLPLFPYDLLIYQTRPR